MESKTINPQVDLHWLNQFYRLAISIPYPVSLFQWTFVPKLTPWYIGFDGGYDVNLKKLHLTSWDNLCSPKKHGDLKLFKQNILEMCHPN